MISINDTRTALQALFSEQTSFSIYQDIVPSGSKSGIVYNIDEITNKVSRDIETGQGHVFSFTVSAAVFSYENRAICDSMTDTFVNTFDGKSTDVFKLVSVDNISSDPYDPDVGAFVNNLTMTFYYSKG